MADMTMEDVLHPNAYVPDAAFPNAPRGWSRAQAEQIARADGIEPGEDHWEAVRSLQNFYAKRADGGHVNVRELHDALDERFHAKGGIKYVYGLFPGGPIAQGCRVAGLEPPAGAADKGFGSVV